MSGLLIMLIVLGSIAVVAWIVGIIGIINRNKWHAEPVISTAFAVMSAAALLTVTFGVTYPQYAESYERHVVDILSVSRGSSVEGSFVLGSGVVSEKSYYFYYYETDKGIKLGKVEANDTYIIETGEFVPSIYEIKEANTFFTYNTLYVPVGTVMTNFVLE